MNTVLKYVTPILASFISICCFGQSKIADNWYFGVLCGMKISATTTSAISSSMVTNEGCAAISDTSGNPLFYTNGVTVWDRMHNVMPNGNGLLGDVSSTQSSLIVPQPGSSQLYYIFTVDDIGGPDGFCYSKVDMTLNGGMGDVTVKNSFLLGNVTEKLTAVERPDAPGEYWIAVHEYNSNAFYIYALTAAGLQLPVISNTGIVHSNAAIQNTYGQMKFSPCGDRLALAAGYLDTIEIFDFNPVNGTLSNPITLPMTDHVYGIEFSQSGRLLYASTYDPSATLVQFDLLPGNAAGILATQTMLSTTPDIYGLQLAANGSIYVCRSFNTYMGAVADPDIAGTGCNYSDTSVFLDPNGTGAMAALSLPGYVQSVFRNETSCITTSIAAQQPDQGIVYPNPSFSSFTINIKDRSDLYIYDHSGRLIEIYRSVAPSAAFRFGELLSAGCYYAKLHSSEGDHHFSLFKL